MIKKIVKDSFTTSNGEDYDVGRILWAVGHIAYIVLSAIAAIKTGVFNPMEFGGGLGAILAGGGAALGMKRKTEAN